MMSMCARSPIQKHGPPMQHIAKRSTHPNIKFISQHDLRVLLAERQHQVHGKARLNNWHLSVRSCEACKWYCCRHTWHNYQAFDQTPVSCQTAIDKGVARDLANIQKWTGNWLLIGEWSLATDPGQSCSHGQVSTEKSMWLIAAGQQPVIYCNTELLQQHGHEQASIDTTLCL